MHARNVVTIRLTVLMLIIGAVTAVFLGWTVNLWFLLFGIPIAAAWLTMALEKQQPGEMLLRAPVRSLSARAVGAAAADTVVWPKREQELLHEYATLCAAAYKGCTDLAPKSWKLRLASNLDGAPRSSGKPWWRIRTGGLHWEIWEHESRPLVAISFRGTEALQIGDWLANLRWGLRWFTYDQYHELRDIAGDLIHHIRAQLTDGANKTIIATGHSLGGGLAQQLAYTTSSIKHVYAFQSSPVTGFHSIPKTTRNAAKKGLRIYRVFEHGEALAFVRWTIRAFLPLSGENPHILEARYSASASKSLFGLVSAHNMRIFAENLSKAAKQPTGNHPNASGLHRSDDPGTGQSQEAAKP